MAPKLDEISREQRTGEVYGSLWTNYVGDKFAEQTHDFWYRYNKYDEWLDPELQGKTCLDVGFGSGRALLSMLNAGAAHVSGIDISETNFNTATENLKGVSDKISLQVGSALDLPYDDNSFDVVHSYGVLHHTRDPYLGFQECTRVLKPGGIFFIHLYNKGGLMNNLLYTARFFTTRSIPPFEWMQKIAEAVSGKDKEHIGYAFLDGLYAPFRYCYFEDEIRGWYKDNGYGEVHRYHTNWFYNDWPKFFSGRDKGGLIMKGYLKDASHDAR